MTLLLPAIATGAPSVVSLFSGIGGIDLAFTWAGFNVVAQVEIDPFCRAVLAKHSPAYWPNAAIHEDVKHVDRSNLPYAPDVIVGGFPCQDISTAGKGAGIKEGTRSGLWIEFARIIGEIRPRFVFLENVAAITARDGVRVIGDLAALGYDAEWRIVAAADVGAPHRRERWFCVAYATGVGLADASRIRCEAGRPEQSLSGIGAHPDMAYTASQSAGMARRPERQSLSGTENGGQPMADGANTGTDWRHRQQTNDGTSGDQWSAIDHRSGNGGDDAVGVVADSNSIKRRTSGTSEAEIGSASEPTSRGAFVVHTTGGRRETGFASEWKNQQLDAGRSQLANAETGRLQAVVSITGRDGSALAISAGSSAGNVTETSSGEVKPRLGVATHGLPGRLVRWPARPGEAQYDWEAPRTTTEAVPQRTAKLKALGNAVVPQVIYPFAVAIYQMCHGDTDREAAR